MLRRDHETTGDASMAQLDKAKVEARFGHLFEKIEGAMSCVLCMDAMRNIVKTVLFVAASPCFSIVTS